MVANHVKWYSKTEPDSTLWRWLDGQLGKPSTICNDLFLYANTVNFALASQQKKKKKHAAKLHQRTATVGACKCERKKEPYGLEIEISGITVRERKKLFKAVKTTTQLMLLTDSDRFTASTQYSYEKWWNIHMLHSALKPLQLIRGDIGNTNWSSDLNWIIERLSAIIWTTKILTGAV